MEKNFGQGIHPKGDGLVLLIPFIFFARRLYFNRNILSPFILFSLSLSLPPTHPPPLSKHIAAYLAMVKNYAHKFYNNIWLDKQAWQVLKHLASPTKVWP